MKNLAPGRKNVPSPRLRYVDMAKCVMLMFVITSHTEAWFVELPVDPILISTFWICSGYTSGRVVCLARKARSLIVPYFVMTALCFMFSVFVAGRDILWTDILGAVYSRYVMYAGDVSASNPCLLRLFNAPLWFLTSLFTGWCVYAVLMRFRRMRTQVAAVAVSLVLAWGATYLPVLLPWSLDTALFAGPMIWIGHHMRRLGVPERRPTAFMLVSGVLYVLFAWMQGWSNYSVRYYGHLWPVPVFSGVTGVAALLSVCMAVERSRAARLLSEINRQSLYIFGMQMIFIGLVPCGWAVMEGWPQRLAAALLSSVCGGWVVGRLMNALTHKAAGLTERFRTRS